MRLDRCKHVRGYFSERVDGEELPAATRAEVGLHLAICPPCKRFWRELDATRAALKALRDVDPEKESPTS